MGKKLIRKNLNHSLMIMVEFYIRFEIEILFNDMDLDKKGKINYKDFARIILNM